MNKKLMAIAVAGALAAPAAALAQSSTVQVYGTVLINYNLVDYGNGFAYQFDRYRGLAALQRGQAEQVKRIRVSWF